MSESGLNDLMVEITNVKNKSNEIDQELKDITNKLNYPSLPRLPIESDDYLAQRLERFEKRLERLEKRLDRLQEKQILFLSKYLYC